MAGAEFAITDGGSIQEECFYLGLPCLLARTESERPEGLGDNIVIGEINVKTIDGFLDSYASLRRDARIASASPSLIVFNEIVKDLAVAANDRSAAA